MFGLTALSKERLADTVTPVSAYMNLCQEDGESFLFESGETHDSLGRYSVVAWDPLISMCLERGELKMDLGGKSVVHGRQEFFDVLRDTLAGLEGQGLPLMPFVGSLVGYIGFEAVGLIERLPQWPAEDVPTARLCLPGRLLVFDHHGRTMTMVALGRDETDCAKKLTEIEDRLYRPLVSISTKGSFSALPPSRDYFLEAVSRAKDYIYAGDIFQVVLSGRYACRGDIDPLTVYRYLRVKSPSPYMFFLDFGRQKLVGASPETLVRVDGDLVRIVPIAGTRGRSSDRAKDLALERELVESEKERAEHVMLVDLARNDCGRVCAYGSIAVSPYMQVERFSHVMHLVSQVTGRLNDSLDAVDALRAGFPAGTVSGAPKVRALEIIRELETGPRGAYGGAVGLFGPGRNLDTCIAIRMIHFLGDEFTIPVGAGIVADSSPGMEYKELEHKAAQSLAALQAAAMGV